MGWDFLKDDAEPRLPDRTRVVGVMLAIGVFTGLVSSLPSPLPEIRLDGDGLILNATGSPLHAGVVFAAGMAFCIWLWITRDLGKCGLTFALVLVGWLAAVNTANDLYQALVGSEVFGADFGAKQGRQVLGLVLGGVVAGAVGAGLAAFGAGISARAMRRSENWILVVLIGAAAGALLYPAAAFLMPPVIFVLWQALVAGTVGFGLTRPR